MKQHISLLAGVALLLSPFTALAQSDAAKVSKGPQLTILQSQKMPGDVTLAIVKDEAGRVYKQRLKKGEAPKPLQHAPKKVQKAKARTFYEGFEGYGEAMSSGNSAYHRMNWIPDGWTKINTPEHTPTQEQLDHNINNSWYVYYSSDFYQEMTSDGETEAFVHFGYNGDYGCNSSAQDEWLVSPSITLEDNETLSFLHQAEPMSTYNFNWSTWQFNRDQVECNLVVMITDDDGANWTKIWDFERDYTSSLDDDECYDFPMAYRNFEVSLKEYAGKTVKIAFRYLRIDGNYVGNSMMIDAVTIEHPGGEWDYLGTGTMVDGWVIPALTEGEYEYNDPRDYEFEVEIFESSSTPGVYKISSPYTSEKFPFLNLNGNKDVAYDIVIDASDPEFVLVDPQISGFEHNNPGNKADRYAVPYYISHAAKNFLDKGTSRSTIIDFGYGSTFDTEKGVITITSPQYGHEREDGTLDMGHGAGDFDAVPTIITLPQPAPEPEWEVTGKATFVDGFLYYGFFGENPKGHGWEVDVMTKSDEPGKYMLVDPYTAEGSPYKDINSANDAEPVKILIDATDPKLVMIEPQYTGLQIKDTSVDSFYIGDLAGWYFAYGYSKAVIQSALEDDEKSTLENGVITVNVPLFGYDAEDEFGYQWVDSNRNPVVFPVKIYLPGATETPEPADVMAEEITLSHESYEGYIGDVFTIEATVKPDETTDKTVEWSTDDPTVATVENGKVTLLSAGETVIRAKCGNVAAVCQVKVKELSSVDSLIQDNDADAVYYTIEGVRATLPLRPGIYIRIAGGKAAKIIVK